VFHHCLLQEVYGAASAAAAAQGADAAVVRDRGLDALLDKTTLLNPEVLMRRGKPAAWLLGCLRAITHQQLSRSIEPWCF
jgi:hypothetical protein